MEIKKKILTVFGLILIILFFLSTISLATEEKIKSDIVVNYENFYELNEKIHKENSNIYKIQNYMSNQSGILLKDYIIQEAKKCSKEIDITSYQIPWADMEKIFIPMLYYEELFFVDSITWSGTYIDSNTIIGEKIYFTYFMTPEEIIVDMNKIDKSVEDYLNGIKTEWNDLEKIIYTNNYLCKKCTYADVIKDKSHTLAGALADERPVCDGYSIAFKYLLKQIGIEASLVTSNAMNHAWNLVKLNENYYHIDVTWNDDDGGCGKVNYEFFLVSDDAFENNRKASHYSWVADYSATDTKYDYSAEWLNTTNYLLYKDNYWYYLSDSSKTYTIGLHKANFRIEDINSTYVTIPTEYVFWSPGLTTDDEYLYFTTKYAMWKMNFDGSDVTEFYRLSDNLKTMYSIEFKDYKFYYDTTDIVIENYLEKTDTNSRKTNIYMPISKIYLDTNSLILELNSTKKLNTTILPEETTESKNVKWESSNPNVVEVDENGNITAISEGFATITVSTLNGKKATCEVNVVDKIIFTTLTTQKINSKEIMNFGVKTSIDSLINSTNFPVLDKMYTVEVYDSTENKKSNTEKIGSKNTIKIKDPFGNLAKEYIIVVKGDVTGNGCARMFDSFQILKDTIVPGIFLDEIDIKIRDYNNDEKVRMYDAFQFLKEAVVGK